MWTDYKERIPLISDLRFRIGMRAMSDLYFSIYVLYYYRHILKVDFPLTWLCEKCTVWFYKKINQSSAEIWIYWSISLNQAIRLEVVWRNTDSGLTPGTMWIKLKRQKYFSSDFWFMLKICISFGIVFWITPRFLLKFPDLTEIKLCVDDRRRVKKCVYSYIS